MKINYDWHKGQEDKYDNGIRKEAILDTNSPGGLEFSVSEIVPELQM